MIYELAKQLKDAGFPQGMRPDVYFIPQLIGDDGEFAYLPTLSELIEACGRSLVFLRRVAALHERKDKWQSGNDIIFYEGSTPEEAVAKLWLALNK